MTSCGRQVKMERCKFVEIEAAEFEVELKLNLAILMSKAVK